MPIFYNEISISFITRPGKLVMRIYSKEKMTHEGLFREFINYMLSTDDNIEDSIFIIETEMNSPPPNMSEVAATHYAYFAFSDPTSSQIYVSLEEVVLDTNDELSTSEGSHAGLTEAAMVSISPNPSSALSGYDSDFEGEEHYLNNLLGVADKTATNYW